MRYLIFGLIILLSSCSADVSSEQASVAESGTVRVTGTVAIPGASKVVFSSNNLHREDVMMDGAGNFSKSWEQEGADQYLMMLGGYRAALYAKPGAAIRIDGQAGNLQFSGDYAMENSYLNEKMYIRDTMPSTQKLFDLSPKAFEARVGGMIENLANHLEAFAKKNKLPDDFLAYARAQLDYEKRQLWQNYQIKNKGSIYAEEIAVIVGRQPADYLVKLDEPSLIIYPDFKNKLWQNFQQIEKLNQQAEIVGEANIANARMDFINQHTKANSEIRNQLYYTTLNQLLNFYRGSELTSIYEQFMQNCQDTSLTSKITPRYEALKAILPGQEAPAFNLPDKDGRMVSLSQFRGKVVAIDLWATWCIPCIEAFPAWEALQEEFKDKEVAFLSVSIDQKPEAWTAMVRDMKGLQLHIGDQEQSTFKADYSIRRIPRYMLIDQEGKIVDLDIPSLDNATLHKSITSLVSG